MKKSEFIKSKLTFLIVLILLTVQIKPQIAFADVSGDYEYTLSGGNAVITKYNGSGGTVTIPATIDGYNVTSIGNYAFLSCLSLTSVIIPNGITRIGDDAFDGCHNLVSVVIPNSVTSIGTCAFLYCFSLTSVTIPSSVSSIGNSAFAMCTGLVDVDIQNGVLSIDNGAFSSCTNLNSVNIPASVININKTAFLDCKNLFEAKFFGNAPVLGGLVFEGCAAGFKVRYLVGKTGYTNPWYGYPTEPFSLIAPERYGGADRFETAAKISAEGWITSDNVILANGLDFADAMAGVPLAHIKDAPILLTYADSVPEFTSAEITRLSAKHVYILGGTGVVSTAVKETLEAKGLTVDRYAGINRFETAKAVANQVLASGSIKTAVITTGYLYPDALSLSPYAAIKNYPILYTYTSKLTDTTKDYLKEKGITKVIIPGLTGAVSQAVENELIGIGIIVQRIGGADRYATSYEITSTFEASLGKDVMISSGENFPDALAGGALAAKKGIPILLVEKENIIPQSAAYINSKGDIKLYITGGNGVISDNLINKILGVK